MLERMRRLQVVVLVAVSGCAGGSISGSGGTAGSGGQDGGGTGAPAASSSSTTTSSSTGVGASSSSSGPSSSSAASSSSSGGPVCEAWRQACGGVCVDVQTDPANCGGCGRACAPGTTCAAGLCSGPPCAGRLGLPGPADFPLPNGNSSLAMGDVNGDGKLDLIVTDTGHVGVLLGNGDGTFAAAVSYPVAVAQPIYATSVFQAVELADLNGDGRLDLVVLNSGLSVLLNNGDGTFGAAAGYPAGGDPGQVAIGDLTGDGRLDLAVTNPGSGVVSLLINNGDGTFAAPAALTAPYPAGVAAVDLNGDGKLDLAVLCQQTGPVLPPTSYDGSLSVFLGHGDGAFDPPLGLQLTGDHFAGIAAGDLDGDGKPDLVVAERQIQNDYFDVLIGHGDGTFVPAVAYAGSGESVTMADLDGDGKPDLVFTPGLWTRLNNGDGTFAPSRGFAGEVVRVRVGDVSGDGKPDLAVVDRYPNVTLPDYMDQERVDVLLNRGGGVFASSYDVSPLVPIAPALEDMDGDGHPDLVVAVAPNPDTSGPSGGVNVFPGKGDGTFGAPVYHAAASAPAGPFIEALDVADLNGDGKPDIVLGDFRQYGGDDDGLGGVFVLLNQGGGAFAPAAHYASVPVNSVAVGDLNGDGKPDLALVGTAFDAFTVHRLSVLSNQGDGTFGAPVDVTDFTVDTPAVVAIVDLDGDGKLDIAVTHGGAVSVFVNQGGGAFLAPVDYTVGPDTCSVVAGDVNGDGKPDLVVSWLSNSGTGGVSVLMNDGDGTLASPAAYGSGAYALSGNAFPLILVDLNGDGKPDIVADGQGGIGVYFNKGDGTFTDPVVFPLGTGSGEYLGNTLFQKGIVAGDANGDGRPDLLVVDGPNGDVNVLLTTCSP
jgi:hypothetical protein